MAIIEIGLDNIGAVKNLEFASFVPCGSNYRSL